MRLADTLLDRQEELARLVICNGVLQGEGYRPERALSQLDRGAMQQVFELNTFTNAGAERIYACHQAESVPEDRGAVGESGQYL